MSKEQYEKVLPPLRDALLAAQKRLTDEKSFALAVIVTGVPTAGRSEIVNEFLEWLDPKHIHVHALEKLRQTARGWPAMWRYWNALPARGEMAFFFMGWYEDLTQLALRGTSKAQHHHARIAERIFVYRPCSRSLSNWSWRLKTIAGASNRRAGRLECG